MTLAFWLVLFFNTHKHGVTQMQYSELSARFSEFSAKREAFWKRMQTAAHQLVTEYEQSLHLASPEWTGQDGQRYRYVRVGTLREDQFEDLSLFEMGGCDDLSLRFVILTTIEESAEAHPKLLMPTQVEIKPDGGKLAVTVTNSRPITVHVTKANVQGKFAAAAEAIKHGLLCKMNPEVFAWPV